MRSLSTVLPSHRKWRAHLVFELQSILDEAVDLARSASQGRTTMRTLFTCFLSWELRMELGAYGTPS